MGQKPVYSTATGMAGSRKGGRGARAGGAGGTGGGSGGGWVKAGGPAKMRLEKGGRGGKMVTVLFNLPWGEEEALRILSELKSSLGCGGTAKDSALELAGDMRDRIEAWFGKRGEKVVRAGG